MKNYIKLLILAIFITVGFQANAQDKVSFRTQAQSYFDYKTNKAIIRWVPANVETWDKGNSPEHGYIVTRYQIERDHRELSFEEKEKSEKQFVVNVKPLENFIHASEVNKDKNYEFAGEAIYNKVEFEITGFEENPMVKAYQTKKNNDTRMMMTLFIADQKPYAAKLMGLLLEDKLENGSKYRYIINLNKLNDEELPKSQISITEVSTYDEDNKPLPSLLIVAEPGDSLAKLTWQQPKGQMYGSYDIYRSEEQDGGFEKVNNLPYLFSSDNPDEPNTYVTKLPNNEKTYYFRIQGHTAFGYMSPESPAVGVKGKPAPLNEVPFIDDITGTEKNTIDIKFSFSDELRKKITGFEIRRAKQRNEEFLTIDKVDQSATAYTDQQPISKAYYIVVALDENGYDLMSVPALAQLEDMTPPNAPNEVTGTMDKDGNTIIKWAANTDEDLSGYQVFISNNEEGEYVPVTNEKTKLTQFTYYVNTQTLAEKVFFKVTAYDFHENRSEFSAPCLVAIPDIIEPNSPVLINGEGINVGVKLHWVWSTSDDVVRHEIQRRPSTEKIWETIKTYSQADAAALPDPTYLDASGATLKEYQYRIVAFDEASLMGTSIIMTIYNMADGFRPSVLNPYAFQDLALKYQYAQDAASLKASGVIGANGITGYIKIYWEYPNTKGIYDFQVYRGIDGGTMKLFKSVEPENALFNGVVTLPTPKSSSGKTLTLGAMNQTKKPASKDDINSINAYMIDDDDMNAILTIKDPNKFTYQLLVRFVDGSTSKLSVLFSPDKPAGTTGTTPGTNGTGGNTGTGGTGGTGTNQGNGNVIGTSYFAPNYITLEWDYPAYTGTEVFFVYRADKSTGVKKLMSKFDTPNNFNGNTKTGFIFKDTRVTQNEIYDYTVELCQKSGCITYDNLTIDYDPKAGTTTTTNGKGNLTAYTTNKSVHIDGLFNSAPAGSELSVLLSGKTLQNEKINKGAVAFDIQGSNPGAQYDCSFEICDNVSPCNAIPQKLNINYLNEYTSISSYTPNYIEIQFESDALVNVGDYFTLMRLDKATGKPIKIASISSSNVPVPSNFKLKDFDVTKGQDYLYYIQLCDGKGNCSTILDNIGVSY
jgi:uncharacterized protein